MADRYLLETGAPDGYLLEDGTGVLLLEGTAAADPFLGSTGLSVKKQRYLPQIVVGVNLLLTTLAVTVSTDVPRGPLAQGLKTKPAVTSLVYPNLVTRIPVDNPVFTQQVASAPRLKRNVQSTPYSTPKTLFDDAQLPVGTKNTYTQPDRVRPVVDTSKGFLELPAPIPDPPVVNPPSFTIKRVWQVNDTNSLNYLALTTQPVVPYLFGVVQKPQQVLADTSKGVSKVFLEEPVVEPPFVPAPHLTPLLRPVVGSRGIYRPEGAPAVAPSDPPIGAKALDQVAAYKPPVWAQNFSIPPDRIPAAPVQNIPEGKQSLTFSPHKRPQVFAEQHYIPPYQITESSIASAYPESQVIVRKPRVVTDTSFRNEAILNAGVVVNPFLPWNFEKPQAVKRHVVDTSKGTPKTLIQDAQLPVGQATPQSFIAQKKWQTNVQATYRNWVINSPVAVTYTITPSGGITFSGDNTEARVRTNEVSGSITFSGTNEFTHIKTYVPTGAITFSGTNPLTFLPEGVLPVTTRLPMTGAGQT